MKIEEIVALDVAPSARSIDENGYMHVALSHITKAQVVPYWGHEIPAWEDRGLEKDKLYYAYRSPDELKKSISTWNGLPIHMEHHVDSAEDPQKWTRVGSSGTDAKWADPYVDNSLTVWDADAQEKIRDGTCKELSCAYRYTPDFTAGEFEGIPYDFVMRDIKGNHIALVEKGRAGRDVVVADAAPEPEPEKEPEQEQEKATEKEAEKETEPKNSERTGAESMPGKKKDELENKALDDDILDDDVKENKSPVEAEKDEDEVEIVKDRNDDGLTKDDADDDATDDGDTPAEDDDGEGEGEGGDDDTKMDKFVGSLNKQLADKLMGKLKDAFPDEGAEDDDEDEEDEEDKDKPVGDDDDDGDEEDKDKPVEDDDEDEPVGDDDDNIKKPVEDEDDLSEDDDEGEEDEAPKMKAFVEALTDTQTKKLLFMLKARLMLNDKKDEAKDKKPAKDNRPAKDCGPAKDSKPAMDADTIRRGLLKDFRDRSAAVRAVRKTCGDLDPMAFDSASDIYGHALKTVGIAMDRYPRSAWAGMYAAYSAAMSHVERKNITKYDPGDFTGAFAGLKNITIGE